MGAQAGKYARLELERRFLVARLPDGIAEDRGWRISDRDRIEHDDCVFSVDVFGGHLAGLLLAEIGFETPEELHRPLDLPSWVIREVSGEWASRAARSPASLQIRPPN